MCRFLLREACDVSEKTRLLFAKELVLKWGGSVKTRMRTLDNRTKSPNEKRSYILVSVSDSSSGDEGPEAIGYGEIKASSVPSSPDILNAVFTAILVPENKRGRGFGKVLMSELESRARDLGCAYIYLWTPDVDAFYIKCGFKPCDESSGTTVAALNQLNEESRSRLEDMFARRMAPNGLGAVASSVDTASLATGVSSKRDAKWLRKRLVDFLPLKWTVSHQAFHQEFTTTLVDAIGADATKTVEVRQVPWARQIGPSCGIVALTMALSAMSPSLDHAETPLDTRCSPVQPDASKLLHTAIKEGFSNDGELFNIHHLATLTNNYLKQEQDNSATATGVGGGGGCGVAELHEFSSLTPKLLMETFRSGSLVLLPYDRGDAGSQPCLASGTKSHYTVLTGFAFGTTLNSEQNSSGHSVVGGSSSSGGEDGDGEGMVGDGDGFYLVGIQGLSPRPVVASLSRWKASNAQLHLGSGAQMKSEFLIGEDGPQLAGLCLILRSLPSASTC